MKRLFLAAMFATMLPASAFAWCGSGAYYDCNINDPTFNNSNKFDPSNTFSPTNTFNPTVNGGAGGNGGQGGQGGDGGKGGNASAHAKATANAAATSNSGGNVLTVNQNQVEQAPSVNAAALASLAATECVLSDTQTAGGSIGVTALGLGVVEGTGHTKPYDECNQRAALPYVAALASVHGVIRSKAHPGGVDAERVYEQMTAGLTGVSAAMDATDPTTAPAQQSSAVPVSAPVQTASAASAVNPSCLGANTHTNWYAAACQ